MRISRYLYQVFSLPPNLSSILSLLISSPVTSVCLISTMAGLTATAEERAKAMAMTDGDHSDTQSLEKGGIEHKERLAWNTVLNQEDTDWLARVPPREQARIFHKVDRRLVPMLALLYLIAHIDRASKDHPSESDSILDTYT